MRRPFWLSPRQVLVVPVGQSFNAYATKVAERLYKAGFFADVEDSHKTMNKKVREGQLAQYNFIFVVGAAEEVRPQTLYFHEPDFDKRRCSHRLIKHYGAPCA